MSSPAMQPPLLEVRDFGLEFRTRAGTVRALEGVNLRPVDGHRASLMLEDARPGVRRRLAIQLGRHRPGRALVFEGADEVGLTTVPIVPIGVVPLAPRLVFEAVEAQEPEEVNLVEDGGECGHWTAQNGAGTHQGVVILESAESWERSAQGSG